MKYANYHKRAILKAAVSDVYARVPLRMWLILLLLFAANIYLAISSATYGAKLMAMEKQIKVTSEENKKLMEKMASQQSLLVVSKKAEDLGLVKPTQIVYLDTPSSLTAAF